MVKKKKFLHRLILVTKIPANSNAEKKNSHSEETAHPHKN